MSFHLQDNEDAIVRNSILKELETRLNDAMTGAKNAIRSESNLVKKCILRRGSSFYTAVKKIKSSKKPRQTFTRRALKNHCANNVENNAIICAIKSEVEAKPFLKAIDRFRSSKSNIPSTIKDTLEPRLNSANKKLMTMNSSAKMRVPSEETAVVRQGAKRLKVISSTRTSKLLPKIGEPSCASEEVSAKRSLKVPHTCDKRQSIKGTRDTARIATCKNRTVFLKEINKTASKESFVAEHKTIK